MPNDSSDKFPTKGDPAEGELSDDQLDAVLGGGILDDVAAAYEAAKAKINELGQQLMNLGGGGS